MGWPRFASATRPQCPIHDISPSVSQIGDDEHRAGPYGAWTVQNLSRERVLGMAPDAAAARAAPGQAVRSKWSGLGRDEQAAWGECQGSGATPYRCQAALADGATRCSCPSRKFPCKHALGLLLLLAAGDVPGGPCPDWVAEWLAARADRQATGSAGKGEGGSRAAPVDPQARQRRADSRDRKVDGGVEELRRWLADVSRGGLAAAQAQPWTWWDQIARRMIDAQARGLAGYVRRLAEIAAAGGQRDDWPERMLDQLGALHLLCEAWMRRDTLPAATVHALRTRIGYTQSAGDVAQTGERITDVWAVLGHRHDDDGQLQSLRQWLYGEGTGTVVTFLAFAIAGQSLEPGLPPGMRTAATVVLYPGSRPQRVLIAEREDVGRPLGRLPGAASWDQALARVADVLAVDPWADVLPLSVRGVNVLPPGAGQAGSGAPWLLRDADGRAVPIQSAPEVRWSLLALSGGRPIDVAGEWDGFGFRPQAAATAGGEGLLVA
jgi:SWIM zinc finger